MGGAPTTIQGPDVYAAMERGTVDGQSVGISACPTWGWCEVQKYATPEFLGCATWALLMNEKTYNSLPADIQKIIDEMAADNKYGMIGAKQLDQVSKKATQCFIDHGGVFVEWGDEVYDELDELFAPIWQAWIEEREAKGLNPRAALDAMYNALLELGVERPALGYKPQ
jgi:TRAP-type C4-dicarboxylate transport system substrate-binding protein